MAPTPETGGAPPRRRGVELLGGLILAAFGVVFAAAALEFGVRLVHLEPDRFWQPDPLIGSRHLPGKTGWWTQEDREFVVPVEINQQGWRDVERPVEKPRGTTRILVLGDSFAEGLQVPLEDTFSRVLEARLKELQAGPVQVINTGTSGFGTAGELLLLQRDGARYDPDIVLLAFYPGNDVLNNSPELEDTLVPVYAADGRPERVVSSKKERQPKSLLGKALAGSKAYQYVRRRLVTGHPNLARRLGLIDGAKPPPRPDFIPDGYFVYAPAEGPWQSAWEHTERLLGQVQSAARQMGAELVVAIVAGRDEVYPEWWAEVMQTYPAMQGKPFDIDAPRKRIVEMCQARGIPVLELAPLMRQQSSAAPLHFHRDGHWTPAGHRLAGDAIANFLVKERLVAKDTEGQP